MHSCTCRCLGTAAFVVLTAAAHVLLAQRPATQPATAPAADNAAMAGLIAQLGDTSPKVRNAAQARLQDIGLPAIPQLTEAAKSTDAEVAQRAQTLLKSIAKAEAEREKKAIAKAMIWSFPVEGGVAASPVIVNGVAVAATADGKLIAVDIATGKEAWSNKKLMEEQNEVTISRPVARGDAVVIASPDGPVYGLKAADGKQLWKWTPTTRPVDDAPVFGEVVNSLRTIKRRYAVMGFEIMQPHEMAATGPGAVVALGEDYLLHVFDPATSKETAAFKPGSMSGRPAVGKDMVFVPLVNDVVQALDLKTGKEVWNKNMLAGDKARRLHLWPRQLILRGDVLYCRLTDGIVAFEAKTGKETWRLTIKDAISANAEWTTGSGMGFCNEPVITDDAIYVLQGLDIRIYDAKRGTLKRTVTAKKPKDMPDPDTALRAWAARADGGLTVAGATAYLGFVDYLLAVDLDSGTTKWELPLEGVLSGAPVLMNGTLYFGTMPMPTAMTAAMGRIADEQPDRPARPGLFALRVSQQ